ncbi:MAG: gliding motility-associated ABC transporter permease subunit GldF [Flavobacteriales bacterium]|nr:gliding motility-associated ABC transporter permease subunit GldF [Flavobacteriales bacterium]NNK81414.1 gliding motility-associated ABC transporter permease subunit GldF [Flavobacteriales bacterium]
MWALLKKEISGFLSSLIGYVVIIVFLLMVGLFMWIFPGEMNVLDKGYADMDTLFLVAPWVFLFLIPAITMRSFSEEKRTGTIELLLTKPLTGTQIILAKFLSGWLLTIISILPTIIYYITVFNLAEPAGNVDGGGILGSYIGLALLSAAFVSIGIFSSSLTENQIVAFIIAVFLCFFIFIGFESIASFDLLGPLDTVMLKLGINEHYRSLSRGVIDTRDVVYFLGLVAIFILMTRSSIESRKW